MKKDKSINTFLAFMANPEGLTTKEIKKELRQMNVDYKILKKKMKQIMKGNKKR